MSFIWGAGSGLGGIASTGWGNNLFAEPWPDPFMDYASLSMPESIAHALRWCEFVFMANGTYREACRRLLAYFITDVELHDASDEVKENWREFLEETLDIKNLLHIVGMDAMCYGNSFTSVIPTFIRKVMCQQCRQLQVPLEQFTSDPVFRWRWEGYQFNGVCPKCSYSGPWRVSDHPTGNHNGFRVKRWNPHDMEILWDPWTDQIDYIWKIPEDYRTLIRQGKPHVLKHAPLQVIQAVKNNNHLQFDRDFVFHMKEDALAGVNNRGWGISRVLANFRQAWYVQVLHRYNEAIALDYVIPFRLLTPVPGDKSTGADVLVGMNAGGYMAQVHQMLRRRRRDPAGWHTLPFPVQYQALGGDARQLAPTDLMNQGLETLLNMVGVPAEMYRGSMTLQAAPVGLRLFEATQSTIPHNYNNFLRFITRKVGAMLRWDPVNPRLARVTHADDAQRQMSKLQLATGGQISQTTGLKAVGLDFKDEIRQMMDDQRFQAEEQARLETEMDQASQMQQMSQAPQAGMGGQAQGGQAAGGGGQQGGGAQAQQQAAMQPQSVVANLPQGPNQKVSPEEMFSRAQYVASQLMGMPESQKDSELQKLKKMDPMLHSVVRSQMDDIRQQAKTQGGSQMLAQQFGKQSSDLTKKAADLLKRLNQPGQLPPGKRRIRMEP